MPNITPPKWSLEKRGKLYFMRYRWEGSKPRIPLHKSTEAEATVEARAYWVKWVEREEGKAAAVKAQAMAAARDASKHLAKVWVSKFIKTEFTDKSLSPKSTSEAERNLGILLRLSGVEYLEDFNRENVSATLADAVAEVKPHAKFSLKKTASGWTVYALVKSWKKWFKWLGEDDLISHKVWNKLKAPMPKPEDKQEQLWFKSQFQGIYSLASELDKELYLILRHMGIDPADVFEMEKKHFKEEGKKWRFTKDRAKKSESKAGTYSQIVDDRALAVLLPRIKKPGKKDERIFHELQLHLDEDGKQRGYKDADSFVSSFGNRNDDYWDLLTFNCTKEGLTEVRKGKNYKKLLADLPVKTIPRKVKSKDGREYISQRAFNGGAKYIPNCEAYIKGKESKPLHSLRYTYATSRVESGVPANELRNAMGHAKDSRVLERFYDHPRDKDEQKKNPLE